jgi:peptide/nickel transport system permease protein
MGLRGYVVKRAVHSFAVFLVVLVVNFLLPRMMPGNPVARFVQSGNLSKPMWEKLYRDFGLDQPLWVQFVLYLRNIFQFRLLGGFLPIPNPNLGLSFYYRETPVMKVLLQRLPWTIYLFGVAYALSIVLGVVIGAIAAWRRGSKTDVSILSTSLFLRSMPIFWLGMIMLFIFSYYFRIFPISGAYTPPMPKTITWGFTMDVIWHSILPIITLTLYLMGTPAFLTRNVAIDALAEPYILTAKAKGLKGRAILFKHALRNVMLPIVSYSAITMAFVVGGGVFTETVFDWPGVGREIYMAYLNRDYPMIQGAFLLIGVSVILANFIVDIAYGFLDPRVKY